ncbi:DUF2797 domain-containing protein [Larsenimonas rhizosphaerae]|uniref:DUF2797 domain-containing protein n=1 Tax=Larsenimonas rhizosphaerae TaxID=2944682 RepID=UPI00203345B1|nr:DUF2797 domain-containing protein [Larsenimonas rhizosphaerae]MCM2130510.1 DUF2797 domain-containing protein [Larsenimonas rhizosphaerae]
MDELNSPHTGVLGRMPSVLSNGTASYLLPVGDARLPIDQYLGAHVSLSPTGRIFCLNCGRKTSRSFAQGHCYPCFTSLARCDLCIMKPETCHFEQGTCREPEWGLTHCFAPHLVYLSNASGPKVGITKPGQVPVRWIDQGASQALVIFRVATRYQSGLVEALLRERVSDRTQWQKMLKGAPLPVDLPALRDSLMDELGENIDALINRFAPGEIQPVNESVWSLEFPVSTWPEKVKAWNLDRHDRVEGVLQGIKGQYLLLDTGVINIRKFGGYEVTLDIEPIAGHAAPATDDLFS